MAKLSATIPNVSGPRKVIIQFVIIFFAGGANSGMRGLLAKLQRYELKSGGLS